MVRILVISSLTFLLLIARENPFFPLENSNNTAQSTNQISKIIPLQSTSMNLPKTARILKKVTIEFINLDGSKETKTLDLDNGVDWHSPLVISQKGNALGDTTELYSYEDTGSQAENSVTEQKKNKKNSKTKHNFSNSHAKFQLLGQTLRVTTKERLIRDFMLVEPHRIVLDFSSKKSVKAIKKEISKSSFTKIELKNHEKYFRVIITLDGTYRYTKKETQEGYFFTLM